MVHINRLKTSYNETPWSFESARRPRQPRQKTRQLDTETLDEDVVIQSRLPPLVMNANRRLTERKPWRRNNCSQTKNPRRLEMLKLQMQIETGGGKRPIPLFRVQIMNPEILRVPEES